MISINYQNAYKEVYTILRSLDEEELKKIPPKVIYAIKNSMNDDYEYEFDEDIDLSEQAMLSETKATLFNIFRDYLSTPEQKAKIIQMQNENREKINNRKNEIYKSTDIFKNKKIAETDNYDNNPNTQMSAINKSKWYEKIINILKKIFNIFDK